MANWLTMAYIPSIHPVVFVTDLSFNNLTSRKQRERIKLTSCDASFRNDSTLPEKKYTAPQLLPQKTVGDSRTNSDK